MPQGKHKKLLIKKVRKGNKGFPMVTIAYYGLNNKIATKIVCGIIKYEGAGAGPMKKWFSTTEIRNSEKVLSEVLSFIGEQEVKSVAINEQIMGTLMKKVLIMKKEKVVLNVVIGLVEIALPIKGFINIKNTA